MYSLLWCADVLITEVSCVYESTKAILQPRPHPYALSRAAAIVKVLPNLHMHADNRGLHVNVVYLEMHE